MLLDACTSEYQFEQTHNERERAVCPICATQNMSPINALADASTEKQSRLDGRFTKPILPERDHHRGNQLFTEDS